MPPSPGPVPPGSPVGSNNSLASVSRIDEAELAKDDATVEESKKTAKTTWNIPNVKKFTMPEEDISEAALAEGFSFAQAPRVNQFFQRPSAQGIQTAKRLHSLSQEQGDATPRSIPSSQEDLADSQAPETLSVHQEQQDATPRSIPSNQEDSAGSQAPETLSVHQEQRDVTAHAIPSISENSADDPKAVQASVSSHQTEDSPASQPISSGPEEPDNVSSQAPSPFFSQKEDYTITQPVLSHPEDSAERSSSILQRELDWETPLDVEQSRQTLSSAWNNPASQQHKPSGVNIQPLINESNFYQPDLSLSVTGSVSPSSISPHPTPSRGTEIAEAQSRHYWTTEAEFVGFKTRSNGDRFENANSLLNFSPDYETESQISNYKTSKTPVPQTPKTPKLRAHGSRNNLPSRPVPSEDHHEEIVRGHRRRESRSSSLSGTPTGIRKSRSLDSPGPKRRAMLNVVKYFNECITAAEAEKDQDNLAEIRRLEDMVYKTKNHLDGSLLLVSEKEALCKELERQVHHVEGKNRRLSLASETLRNELEQSRKSAAAFEEKYRKSKSTLKEVRSRGLQEKESHVMDENQRLLKENDTLRHELTKSRDHVTAFQDKYSKCKSKLNSAIEEHQNLFSRLRAYKAQTTEQLQAERGVRAADMRAATQALEASGKKHEELEARINNCREDMAQETQKGSLEAEDRLQDVAEKLQSGVASLTDGSDLFSKLDLISERLESTTKDQPVTTDLKPMMEGLETKIILRLLPEIQTIQSKPNESTEGLRDTMQNQVEKLCERLTEQSEAHKTIIEQLRSRETKSNDFEQLVLQGTGSMFLKLNQVDINTTRSARQIDELGRTFDANERQGKQIFRKAIDMVKNTLDDEFEKQRAMSEQGSEAFRQIHKEGTQYLHRAISEQVAALRERLDRLECPANSHSQAPVQLPTIFEQPLPGSLVDPTGCTGRISLPVSTKSSLSAESASSTAMHLPTFGHLNGVYHYEPVDRKVVVQSPEREPTSTAPPLSIIQEQTRRREAASPRPILRTTSSSLQGNRPSRGSYRGTRGYRGSYESGSRGRIRTSSVDSLSTTEDHTDASRRRVPSPTTFTGEDIASAAEAAETVGATGKKHELSTSKAKEDTTPPAKKAKAKGSEGTPGRTRPVIRRTYSRK
ncbi:hypothetical protein FALBO_12767 [Fusarium albosuccineum]|uniref:Uncharacterized protein n=1 Tax=Fusarium albosuccineum TaxID=1237068 RepID=A0A8H4L399_9HYPO|nr:hypothetical protein FALBO_12767 [Fusarium albosuccineum]